MARSYQFLLATLLAVGSLLLNGCASKLTGDVYSRDEARRVQWVQFGVVEDVRPVVIEGRRSPLGGATGAVVGGIAGSEVGGGKGKSLATVIGAVAGGVVGSEIEERATRAQGIDITIRMQQGGMISVVQEVEQAGAFKPGDKVRVLRIGDYTRVTYWPYDEYPASPQQPYRSTY